MISTGQKGDLPTRGLRRPACIQRPFSLRKRITRRFSFRMASRRRIVGRVLLFGGFPKKASRPGVDMNLINYNALPLSRFAEGAELALEGRALKCVFFPEGLG